MSAVRLARPEIIALSPYSAAAQEDMTIRLNANEVPWNPASQPGEHLNRYPQIRPLQLRERLAAIYRVPAQQLLVARGSSEAIDLLIRVFCRPGQDNVIIAVPTFGMYKVYADIQSAEVRTVQLRPDRGFNFDLAEILRVSDSHSKLVFICSPNNPTGNSIRMADLETLLSERQGRSLIVVDEAYIEFSPAPSAVALMERFDNLVILRTLSKAHGLAATRLGSVMAQPGLIKLLDCVMAPYSIATPIAERALDVLSDGGLALLATRVGELVRERQRLMQELSGLSGVARVWPSDGNFLLVRFHDLELAKTRLAGRRILIRDFSADPGLQDCARITVGSPAENDLLLDTLAQHAQLGQSGG